MWEAPPRAFFRVKSREANRKSNWDSRRLMGPQKDEGVVRPAPGSYPRLSFSPSLFFADPAQILVPGENLFISRFILDLPPLPLMPFSAFCMA